jgi:hypothetical protein
VQFSLKSVRRDNEGYFILIKGTIHQEEISFLNIYAPNTEYRIFKPVELTIRRETKVERRKTEEMNNFGCIHGSVIKKLFGYILKTKMSFVLFHKIQEQEGRTGPV